MTATLASTARSSVRTPARTSPVARPVLGGPVASPDGLTIPRRPHAVASCRVVSPSARHAGLVLRLKVSAVAMVALVGIAASAAEFSTWTEPDPAVEYVAGDPAWDHVTGY